jgi:hypothetical protein
MEKNICQANSKFDTWKQIQTAAMLEMVRQDGRTLYYVPLELRTAEVCMAAVEQYGVALCHVPAELRSAELCLAAVAQDDFALDYVPAAMRSAAACMKYHYNDNEKVWRQVNGNTSFMLDPVKESQRGFEYKPFFKQTPYGAPIEVEGYAFCYNSSWFPYTGMSLRKAQQLFAADCRRFREGVNYVL